MLRLSEQVICPECNTNARRIVSPVSTVGPLFSTAIHSVNLDRTFRSKSEIDNYQKRTGQALVMPGSAEMTRVKNRVREKVERGVRRRGYRDLEDRKNHLKEKKKEKAIKAVEARGSTKNMR